jgi:hypothetical protein
LLNLFLLLLLLLLLLSLGALHVSEIPSSLEIKVHSTTTAAADVDSNPAELHFAAAADEILKTLTK